MDRGLLRFPHVGGFGSERQDPEVSGEFEPSENLKKFYLYHSLSLTSFLQGS